MKLNLFAILSLVGIFLLGCKDSVVLLDDSNITEFSSKDGVGSSYVISVEEAMNNLTDFLESVGEPRTRCSDLRIEDVVIIPRKGLATRGGSDSSPLLYAVNFPNDEGYAILAADKRIGDEVLAVTEKGTITYNNFEPYCSYEASEDDDIFEEQYNEMSSAGYVGAYSDANLIGGLCYTYAAGIDTTCVDVQFPDLDDVDYYRWVVTKQVGYKLTTVWDQDSPFNDLCPKVGLFKREKAPAGCVPIAVGQIVAYHEYPNLTCNGVNIDYSSLKKIRNKSDISNAKDTLGRIVATNFIHFLSSGLACDVYYGRIFGISFGFALPSSAKRTFELLGYDNVNLNWNYSEDRVISSLDKDCPVFISAIAGLVDGHAWVIDGYKMRNYVSPEGRIEKTQCLVHCNWGWRGQNNGYFVSGIFKTKEAVSYDWSYNPIKEKYWYAFNTITYDKPIKTN